MLRTRHVLLLALLALAAAGCGTTTGEDRPDESATLVLDFTPNAVHAGIYTALERGLRRRRGRPRCASARRPRRPTRRAAARPAARDFAILDIHDLALAREKGRDVVGVMARRAAAARRRDGAAATSARRATSRAGAPASPACRATTRCSTRSSRGDGGDPTRVSAVTIGFNAVARAARPAASTRRHRVLERRGRGAQAPGARGIREFRVDDFGAPPYPELVLVATRETLDDEPARRPRRRPGAAPRLRRRDRGPARRRRRASSRRRPARPGRPSRASSTRSRRCSPTGGRYGTLDPERLRAWGDWEAEVGIVEKPVDVDRAFAVQLANGS